MFHKGAAELFIDCGSEFNLIEESVVDSNTWVNRKQIYNLTGVGSGMIKTLGEINLKFKGGETKFQIVSRVKYSMLRYLI